MASLQEPTERTSASFRVSQPGRNDEHLGIALLQTLWGDFRSRDFAVRFWDGVTWDADAGRRRRFTLVLKSPDALFRILTAPTDLALGEAYVCQDIDIEGDVELALDLADEILKCRSEIGLVDGVRIWLQMRRLSWAQNAPASLFHTARFAAAASEASEHSNRTNGSSGEELTSSEKRWRSSKPVRRHTPAADQSAIAYHYDVSNEFYQLWLDSRMVYSCAYFSTAGDDLETAQERKLDYVCRKLRLERGERFLDLGCGWGGLVIHAAQHFGVDARGITLSREQADLAGRRIEELGLSGRCRVEYCDYRALAVAEGPGGLARLPGHHTTRSRAWGCSSTSALQICGTA